MLKAWFVHGLIALSFAAFSAASAGEAADAIPAENLLGKNFPSEWRALPEADRPDNLEIIDGLVPVGPNATKVANESKAATTKPVVARDETVRHNQRPTLKMMSVDPENIVVLQVWDIPVDPDTEYVLRVAIRGEAVAVGATFFALATAPTGGLWGGDRNFVARHGPKGTFDWQVFELPLTTRSDDAQALVSIQLRAATGTLWIGSVELVEKD